MDAFAMAVAAIHADPNLGADAVWRAGGAGEGIPVRVVRKSPDEIVGLRDSRIRLAATLIDVRLADVPDPAQGDTVEFAGSVVFEVTGLGARDSAGLVQTCEASPVT